MRQATHAPDLVARRFRRVGLAVGCRAAMLSVNGSRCSLDDIPLLIDFATPSSIFRERNRSSALRILGNGPPGTFVVFPGGLRVSLPTDQIVFSDDTGGHARVGFGGMQFVGAEDDRLVFARVRELLPEDQLSPARSHTMLLDSHWVTTVSAAGRLVWPGGPR